MNKSDSERITSLLENIGYEKASRAREADLIVINMCSVRQSAVDRVYGKIKDFKNLKSKRPNLKTALTGCILKKDRKKLEQKFDIVFDIKNLPNLPNLLGDSPKGPINNNDYLQINPKHSSSFIAYVPIMTGCNKFCSYCAVPYTRGREKSRPAEEILCQVKKLTERNYKEIWLLGENVNSYHDKQESVSFSKLLQKINNIKGNFWIRFTSPHPKDFSDELIKTMADCEKITEYLNLPVQSGDDKILRRMNRNYTAEKYKHLVSKIKKEIPNIALSTDIIVGFPGETKSQFKNTAQLMKDIRFDMAYIARYSPRPGTAAADLIDSIPNKEKKKREKFLTKILKQTAQENNKKYIAKEIKVLSQRQKSRDHEEFIIGKSRKYKTVKFKGEKNLIGKFVKVKITNTNPWGLKGRIKN